MTAIPGTVAFDEYGRPFIILRNQEKQQRLTGHDAIKVRSRRRRPILSSRPVYHIVHFLSICARLRFPVAGMLDDSALFQQIGHVRPVMAAFRAFSAMSKGKIQTEGKARPRKFLFTFASEDLELCFRYNTRKTKTE